MSKYYITTHSSPDILSSRDLTDELSLLGGKHYEIATAIINGQAIQIVFVPGAGRIGIDAGGGADWGDAWSIQEGLKLWRGGKLSN